LIRHLDVIFSPVGDQARVANRLLEPFNKEPCMRRFFSGLFLAAIVFNAGSVAKAETVLYEQNFDTDDTVNWTTNDSGVTDIAVDYHYDYSAIGVSAAPGGASTFGLKMTANNANGVFGGFSVSPTGESFTGSYRVSFNLWQNYVGPVGPGGSGTTQLSTFGVGTSGTTAIYPGVWSESVGFAATLDGGSASDFRAYSSTNQASYAEGNAVYAAPLGARNGSDAYYSGFGGEAAPAAQVGLFPGQTGVTDAGEIAFAWRNVTIDVNDISGTATWSIDGLQIAQVGLTGLSLGGQNIFFGHSDSNAGISSDPNASLLNVTLIDNIRVTAVPEPSALGLGLIGATLTLVRRRRR
jgi:hypothetical protein